MMPKKAFAFSFSHLTSFETCPKKYYYTYIDKKYSDVNSANFSGAQIHKHIENYFKGTHELPLELTYLKKLLKPYYEADGEKTFEQNLALDRNFEPCSWFDNHTYVRSIIDLLVLGKKQALIVDWKTGKRLHKDFTQLRIAGAMLFAHRPQLDMIHLRYEYFSHRKGFTDFLRREDVSKVWEEVLPRANRIEIARRNDEFPANPNGLCKKYCNVLSCPHHGG